MLLLKTGRFEDIESLMQLKRIVTKPPRLIATDNRGGGTTINGRHMRRSRPLTFSFPGNPTPARDRVSFVR